MDNVGAAELDVGGDVGVDGDSDGGVQAATVSASAPKTAAVVRMADCMRRILGLGFMPGFGIGTEPRGNARRARYIRACAATASAPIPVGFALDPRRSRQS